jgi:Proteobacterial lipase chaperone protein
MSKRVLIVIGAAAAVAVLVYLGTAGGEATSAPAAARASVPERAGAAPALPGALALGSGASPGAAVAGVDPALVEQLQAEYGAGIEHPSVQMRMIEALMRYFQERDPVNWQAALLAAVRAAFPELHDRVAALLRDRLKYEAWMDENRARLAAMDGEARREALRQAREDTFGPDVAEELWASDIKNRALGDALVAIDTQDGTSVSDKLSMYRQSLAEVHGDQVDGYLEKHRHQAMTRFFDLSSVQKELEAMAPDQRRQTMRALRRGMGLDEESLGRWDDLDRARDQRWDSGARYMAERAALAGSHSGEELEQRVHELRVRYFGGEADTIRAEEQSGFFRFERERRWGRD